jgi:ABC-type Fe3+/spermidine/putrescine transport system ATPase subunit
VTADDVLLRFEAVGKEFGKTVAVHDCNLEVRRGEIFTLLGPSGCGKTTSLRMVAGLERPDQGCIVFNGRTVANADRGVFVPPHKRNVGMVFQSYAIWPHMSVFENVAYPLRIRGIRGAELRRRVELVLSLVSLDGMGERQVPTLSGGQQQRVALCRAIVYEPDLLLLDEAFSNLDAKLRNQMRVEVKLLQRRLGITVLLVTHDQVEALTLSDRIGVMNNGRLEQVGPAIELYDRPATPFVRDFLGQTLTVRGTVLPSSNGRIAVALAGEGTRAATVYSHTHSLPDVKAGVGVYLSIRPEDVQLEAIEDVDPRSPSNALPGVIQALLFVGDRFEARVLLSTGESVLLQLPRSNRWREGKTVLLTLPEERTHVWPQ